MVRTRECARGGRGEIPPQNRRRNSSSNNSSKTEELKMARLEAMNAFQENRIQLERPDAEPIFIVTGATETAPLETRKVAELPVIPQESEEEITLPDPVPFKKLKLGTENYALNNSLEVAKDSLLDILGQVSKDMPDANSSLVACQDHSSPDVSDEVTKQGQHIMIVWGDGNIKYVTLMPKA